MTCIDLLAAIHGVEVTPELDRRARRSTTSTGSPLRRHFEQRAGTVRVGARRSPLPDHRARIRGAGGPLAHARGRPTDRLGRRPTRQHPVVRRRTGRGARLGDGGAHAPGGRPQLDGVLRRVLPALGRAPRPAGYPRLPRPRRLPSTRYERATGTRGRSTSTGTSATAAVREAIVSFAPWAARCTSVRCPRPTTPKGSILDRDVRRRAHRRARQLLITATPAAVIRDWRIRGAPDRSTHRRRRAVLSPGHRDLRERRVERSVVDGEGVRHGRGEGRQPAARLRSRASTSTAT